MITYETKRLKKKKNPPNTVSNALQVALSYEAASIFFCFFPEEQKFIVHYFQHSTVSLLALNLLQGSDVLKIPRRPHGTRGVQRRRRQEVRPLQHPQLPEESTRPSWHLQRDAGELKVLTGNLLR